MNKDDVLAFIVFVIWLITIVAGGILALHQIARLFF